MNKILKSRYLLALLFISIIIPGCTDDIADEIKQLQTSRLFSPTSLDARVVNQTSVRLEWRPVRNASSYEIEFHENGTMDFSSTPVRTLTDITETPLIVPGFAGETSYSVRVKAVGEAIDESLWVAATFTTSPEQILRPVEVEDITATGVTLRWTAGETVTSIVLNTQPATQEIVYNPSQEEINAGVAVVEGLTGETTYTVQLMNGSKVRGTRTFTTLVDLGGVIQVSPTDDLKQIIEAAEEGDVFALLPGTYAYPGNIFIHVNVEVIGAEPANRPVVTGVTFRMRGGAGIKLKDLILDGATAPDGNQTIVYEEVGLTYSDVVIEDCVIRNYVKGVFYVNISALIESVTIRNTIYHNITTSGGDFIDFRSGIAKKFDFYNNTVYNSTADRDLFRMDAGGSTNFPAVTSIITIRNNTFHNVINVNTRRILYIRLASHEITVKDNIFSQTAANYSNQSATRVVSMTGNNYFNAPNLTNAEYTVHDTADFTTLNPGFTNADGGNFTVSNPDLILNQIGDPRWLP
jgi:hypothetical protein